MLTFDPTMLKPGVRHPVQVEVGVVVVQLALLYVIESNGWERCPHTTQCDCHVVADSEPRQHAPPIDVLVVRDAPAACQAGLECVVSGRASSLVLWDAPESLQLALEGLCQGNAVIPRRVIDLARAAPRLTRRQRDTLRLLALGRSSRVIAEALHQSESTTKRDISELLQLFDAPNRAAMISAASGLGFLAPVGATPTPRSRC